MNPTVVGYFRPNLVHFLRHTSPTGTTLYLGSYELRRTVTGVTCTRHYGGVAARTTTGGLAWQATDHHNTGQLTINPTTLATTRRKSDPFGNPRGNPPSWPTTRGFVDGTTDPTGLTHLGAREYDPTAGRFISVDPIMNLADPIQMNGYTYANSNPTTASDPNGLLSCYGRQEGDLCPGNSAGPWAPSDDAARDRYFGGGTKSRKPDNAYTGSPVKKAEPTVLDVLDQLVHNATGGKVAGVTDWIDKTCKRIGQSKCDAARQQIDRFLQEAGGKPFDCSAFPNPKKCQENFIDWMADAYEHLEVTVGICDVICASLEYQGGFLHLVVGVGPAEGVGGTIVWNTHSYGEQGSVSLAVCGSYYVGACYGFGPTVDTQGEWVGVNHTFGVSFGFAQVRPILAYTAVAYNVHSGEWSTPQDPMPLR